MHAIGHIADDRCLLYPCIDVAMFITRSRTQFSFEFVFLVSRMRISTIGYQQVLQLLGTY